LTFGEPNSAIQEKKHISVIKIEDGAM